MQFDSENASDAQLLSGVRNGQRRALAKAITLVESSLPTHRARAQALIDEITTTLNSPVCAGNTPSSVEALRIGISGVPGVGKSTFIEALGLFLIGKGHRVAVLAVDPSSSLTGGSILGDKTRMEQLSLRDAAFIRPSPSSGALGGVTDHTREAILLCEAAGYDIIIVETVGVGQSEIAVAAMTDLFVLLQLPNAGDDLQAIKKGIMELADLVIFNKADIDLVAAQKAVAQMRLALAMLRHVSAHWTPQVMSLSALKQEGLADFWQLVSDFRLKMQASGEFATRRKHQALAWMNQQIDTALRQDFREHPAVAAAHAELSAAVESGSMTPAAAAQRLLALARQ